MFRAAAPTRITRAIDRTIEGNYRFLMNPNVLPVFLQTISAAVTPVVMLSACSTLILGINTKHTGLSDRVRAATMEYRQQETSESRRTQLVQEIGIFHQRFVLTWLALCVLYGAVIFFILTTLLIIVMQNKMRIGSGAPLSLFIFGVALMLCAAFLELGETSLAAKSLRVEMKDILTLPHSAPERKLDSTAD